MGARNFSGSHCRLVSEIRYGVLYNEACAKLYSRGDIALNGTQLVGGAGAVVAVVNSSQRLTLWVGVALALASAIAILWQPGIKAERHRAARLSFALLEGRAWKMETDALQAEISSIRATSPEGISLLAVPSYNAMARSVGAEKAQRPETWLQRLFSALA